MIQALLWNLGTCRSDDKGKSQVEAPWSEKVPKQSTGAESPVVVKNILQWNRSEGVASSRLNHEVNLKQEELNETDKTDRNK